MVVLGYQVGHSTEGQVNGGLDASIFLVSANVALHECTFISSCGASWQPGIIDRKRTRVVPVLYGEATVRTAEKLV